SRSRPCLARPGSARPGDYPTGYPGGDQPPGYSRAADPTVDDDRVPGRRAAREARSVRTDRSRPTTSRVLSSTVAAALSALLVVACGGGGGSARTTATKAAAPRRSAPAPTTTSLPPGSSLIAQVSAPAAGVYDDPSSPQPKMTFGPTWNLDDDPSKPTVPEVFLVQEQRPGWVRVLLPTRPNGSTGWLRAGDVQINVSPYHIQVNLAPHQITGL